MSSTLHCSRTVHDELKENQRQWRAAPLLRYTKRAADPWKRYEERQCKRCGKPVQRVCPSSEKTAEQLVGILTAPQKHVLGLALGVSIKGAKKQPDKWATDRLVIFGLLDGQDLKATEKGRATAEAIGITSGELARTEGQQADPPEVAYQPTAAGAALDGPPDPAAPQSHVFKVLRHLAGHAETTAKAERRGTARSIGIGRTSVQYACKRITERQDAVIRCLERVLVAWRDQAMPEGRTVAMISTWKHPGLLLVVLTVVPRRTIFREFTVLADPERGPELEAGLALEVGIGLRWLLSDTPIASHALGWFPGNRGVRL